MTPSRGRPRSERTSAVWGVVEAARRVASAPEVLAPRIVADTGLTPAGVAWAFAHHLETSPTEEEIEALVATSDEAGAVAVILSANVFTAALRAVALACAAAPRVLVRPSRRDPTFASALVEAARSASISLALDLDVSTVTDADIHVYGRDATIADVRARARPGVRILGHGAGMGVAYVSAPAEIVATADALALDVVAFDQRGCLSPRVVLVAGDEGRARDFGEALHAALTTLGGRVPRGRLDAEERAAARRFRETLAYSGQAFEGAGHLVGVAATGAPLLVPPPGRHVFVVGVPDLPSARAMLVPFAPLIVAVGSDDLDEARRVAPAHARLSYVGEMQRPPLDGPVDRRTTNAP